MRGETEDSATRLSSDRLRSEAENVRGRLSSIQEGVLQAVNNRRSWQHPTPRVRAEDVAMIKEVKALERTMERQEAVIGKLERTERYDFPRRQSRDVEWQGMMNGSFYNTDDGSSDDEYRSEGNETDYRSVLEELDELEPDLDSAHEDRADAFDYENFIIHSVFNNTGVRPRRVSSTGSVDSSTSASTPRGPAESYEEEAEGSMDDLRHSNQSVDSFETAQTFMHSSGSDSDVDYPSSEGEEELLQGDGHDSWPMPPSTTGTRQLDPTFDGSEPATPRGDEFTKGSVLQNQRSIGARPASVIFSALVDPLATKRGLPSLDEDDQTLLRSLAEALRFASLQLQRNNLDAERAAEWRSRLQDAQHILSGQDEMM